MNKKQTKKQTIFSTTKSTRGSDEMIKLFSKKTFKNKGLHLSVPLVAQPEALILRSGCATKGTDAAKRSRL